MQDSIQVVFSRFLVLSSDLGTEKYRKSNAALKQVFNSCVNLTVVIALHNQSACR